MIMNNDHWWDEDDQNHSDDDYREVSTVRVHLFGALPFDYEEDPFDPHGLAD